MTHIYPAIFHCDDDGFWVDFPDLIGCQSFGDSLEETFSSAKEALSTYLLTLIDDNKKLPSPSKIKDVKVEDKNAFVSLIEGNLLEPNKSVKKTLTIPSWLNTKAMDENINFSQVLQKALIERLEL